jgi:calcineurin-like phosphoesterase family protein
MKVFLTSDTHINHENIKTYCQRPDDFTSLILKRWNERVRPEDTVIHLGDVIMGHRAAIKEILAGLNGTKILIRGNHDRKGSCSWWMDHGFNFACDGMKFRNCWLTHEPDSARAGGSDLNIHGHLHNIWHGFHAGHDEKDEIGQAWQTKRLKHDWQRLFAIEYTDYYPVEFDHFVSHPDRYNARGIK